MVEAQKKESFFSKVKGLLTNFGRETTLQGVAKLVSSRRILNKLFWVLMLLFVWIYCIVVTIMALVDFAQNNVSSFTGIHYEHMPQFPAVRICHHNKSNTSYLFNNHPYFGINEHNNSCSVFNSGYDQNGELVEILNSHLFGRFYGLRINVRPLSTHEPIIVYIYNQTHLPQNRIPITSGSNTIIRMSRLFTERLGPPYSSCQSDLSPYLINANQAIPKRLKYEQSKCFKKCRTQKMAQLCGFSSNYTEFLPLFFSNPSLFDDHFKLHYEECSKTLIDEFNLQDLVKICSCPPECEAIHYTFETLSNLDVRLATNSLETNVSIFFDYFGYTLVQEVPSMGLDDLFGKIGGVVGLLTGATLIGMAELAELVFYHIWMSILYFGILKSKSNPKSESYAMN